MLGALGGLRVDHALANVGLLTAPRPGGPRGLPVRRAGGADLAARGRRPGASVGPHALTGRVGDLVSLVPVGETGHRRDDRGLRYPLAGEPLAARAGRAGMSNVRIAEKRAESRSDPAGFS